MNLFKRTFFIVLLLAVCVITNGQTEADLRLITPVEDFKTAERVLLVLDQDFYLAGENVNFFALTFDAAFQIPIELSAVLYVELFNQDNNVISAKKYLLKKGEGNHAIVLPRQLETGYYYLRAYTNYMKNFGAGAFFTKRIKVVNPFIKTNYPYNEELSKGEIKLNINPEGGKLIYGIENKLTFSNAVKERILVRLYENDSVLAETDTKNGFGIFNFIPHANHNYRVEAASVSRGKTMIELKNIVTSGVVCKLDSVQNRNAFLKIISKGEANFPLSLFVENNGLLYKYPYAVSTAEALLKMELPAGLNKITVINSTLEEVSQRLVFIEPKANFNITVKPFNTQAFPNDSLVLQINADTIDSVHYLVAINLGDSATSPSLQEMIKSSLYASSMASLTNQITVNELKYFSSNATDVNDYILTFQDTSTVNHRPVKINYLPEISGDIVTGIVNKMSDQSPADDKNIYLSFVDSICWVNRCKTNSQGRFITTLPFDHQGENVVITVQDTTNAYMIKLDDEFFPDFLKVNKENYYPDSMLKETIESRMVNLQVNDAYPEGHKRISPSRSSLRFYGYPDAEYKFRKYVTLPYLEEFVFEIVKEATIVRKGKQVALNLKNSSNENIGDNPLVIFDGVPLLKTDKIGRIPSEKLESIRVIGNKFFWGNEVYDGVIDITSNTKSFDLVELDKNSARILFSPIINEKGLVQTPSARIPSYLSAVYFNKISTVSGGVAIKVHLPQNTGNNSLSIVGYTPTGEWGSLSIPKALKVGR